MSVATVTFGMLSAFAAHLFICIASVSSCRSVYVRLLSPPFCFFWSLCVTFGYSLPPFIVLRYRSRPILLFVSSHTSEHSELFYSRQEQSPSRVVCFAHACIICITSAAASLCPSLQLFFLSLRHCYVRIAPEAFRPFLTALDYQVLSGQFYLANI